jgi:hypothetical protein
MNFNKDQLNNVNQDAVGAAVVRIVDRVQQLPPAVQVAALAVTSVLLAENLDINHQDAMTVARNVMTDQATGLRTHQFRGMARYLREEVSK